MSLVPSFKYPVPTLNHTKRVPYIDFPIAYNEIITNEAFYVDEEWTFVTSDETVTHLYKWNGIGWTEVLGWDNPERFFGRGFFSVSTTSAATCAVTEYPIAYEANVSS